MKVLPLLVFFLLTPFLMAQDVVDRIIAVVSDEIILQSELDFETRTVAYQNKLNVEDPDVKKEVLQAMIDRKLIFAQAELDSIVISEEQLNQHIEQQIGILEQQFGSKERVEEIYGMKIEKIKREIRDELRKNLMIQQLREMRFGSIEASRREVYEFFDLYKDSLGIIPEKVKIYHIFKNPSTTETLKQKYRDLAEAIRDSIINHGADFSEMAKKYSDDPGSSQEGGDLGFVKRGVFYPEFEAAAFALGEGEISEVIESPVGFHIIELKERRGEAINTRHILIKIKADDKSDLEAIDFLNELRDSIISGKGTFQEFAKEYSDDKETSKLGGYLGTLYLKQVEQQKLLDVVSKLKEGEISYPNRINYSEDEYGYHIVYLEKRIPQHQPDIEIDYADIKVLADEYKRQQEYELWIKELKEKIYWEIKAEELKID